MKKDFTKVAIIVGIVVLVIIVSLMISCLNKPNSPDPREKEVIRAIGGIEFNFEAARAKARELYSGEELKETLDWLNAMEKDVVSKYSKYLPKLKIQDGYSHKIKGDYVYITGRVKNVSDSTISYFEVVVKFLDDNGRVLDSDYTNDSFDLKPGEMRSFEIMSKWNDDYKQYSLSIGDVR